MGPLITVPLTPAQWVVLTGASGYAAGRAVGQMSIGGVTIDERVTRLFTGLIAGPEKIDLGPTVLSKSGGRLGKESTREHVGQVADGLKTDGYDIVGGGQKTKEEYIPGPGGARKGSAYPDITAVGPNGDVVRINTVDTRADGVTPTTREQNNADKIRRLRPDDELRLIPKPE